MNPPMSPAEIQFILDNLAELIVNTIITAVKNDPQVLEALNEVVKYDE